MNSTMDLIRKHFANLPPDTIVSPRELTCYGPRERVDDCTYRLRKSGEIKSVIRGLFVSSKCERQFDLLEIVKAKAKAFGRAIYEHAQSVACKLGLLENKTENLQRVFATDGHSSSFKVGQVVVKLAGMNKDNTNLGDTPPGKVARALRSLGKGVVTKAHIDRAVANLNLSERIILGKCCSMVPAWLSRFLWIWNLAQPMPQEINAITIIKELFTQNEMQSNHDVLDYKPK